MCAYPRSHSDRGPVFRLACRARLPLPSRCNLGKPRTRSLAGQLSIGKPFAENAFNSANEPGGVAGLPVVIAIGLLIKVSEQVERLNADVSSLDGPLQETPEVLNPIGVNLAPDVCLGMVNDLVGVGVCQIIVGLERVCVDLRTWLNHVADFRRETLALDFGDHLRPDRAVSVRPVAFQQAHDRSLADGAASVDGGFPLLAVHVAGFAADECLIDCNVTGHAPEVTGLHGEPDALKHEPRGFLSDANGAVNFVGADPVLGIGDHPDSGEPLVQPDGATLKDGSNLDRELTPRVLALAFPHLPGRNLSHISPSAGGANNAIRPAEIDHESVADFRVREVPDCFDEGLRFAVHITAPVGNILI